MTDKGLASLKGLENLEMLYLERTGATDRGLPRLRPLKSLTYVNLHSSSMTDEGISLLEAAVPGIRAHH